MHGFGYRFDEHDSLKGAGMGCFRLDCVPELLVESKQRRTGNFHERVLLRLPKQGKVKGFTLPPALGKLALDATV